MENIKKIKKINILFNEQTEICKKQLTKIDELRKKNKELGSYNEKYYEEIIENLAKAYDTMFKARWNFCQKEKLVQ